MMAHRDEPATQNHHHTYAQQHPPQTQGSHPSEGGESCTSTAPLDIKSEMILSQVNQADERPTPDLSLQNSPVDDERISSLLEEVADLPYSTATPISLLTYLRSIKEIELYYYLFNQVSIVNIVDNKLEISREGADKSLNNKLAEILFTWTGSKWSVIITDTPDQQSLKEKMKAKFMESEEWKMLQGHAGGVTLTDIILD